MKGEIGGQESEIARYTKYYEHDGMLRAYANRAMVLAMILERWPWLRWALPSMCGCNPRP